jgi:type IV fimbrial biogenesis protein FimT
MAEPISCCSGRFRVQRDAWCFAATLYGFTLIEMMAVVAVVAIIAILAAPYMRAVILNQGIKAASFDLYSALEYARSEAIKRNGSISLMAGPTSGGTWATGWRVEDAASNPLRSWTVASTVTVTETAGGATLVTFGRDGHVTAPVSPPKLQVDPTETVPGTASRCIQVDLVGRAKTQHGACPP